MKTTKFFFMAALALMTAACSSNDDELIQQPVEQPANNMITITAKLAPKSSSAQTRAMNESGGNIVVDWAQNEQLQIISANGHTATANIDNVTSGTATISFSIDAAAVGQNCTIVYPASAATTTGVKAYAANTALTAQDGTLKYDIDVRVGAGTISASNPGTMAVTTQPEAQYSIFKFTLQDLSAADKSATEFKVSDGSGNVMTTVTSGSASGELYVALPVMAAGTYWFNATIDSKPYIAKATTAAATVAGKYYQTTVKMATIGDVILDDGKFAVRTSTGTKVAMIAYLGNDAETSPTNTAFKNGLALALGDVSGTQRWCSQTNATCLGTQYDTSTMFNDLAGIANTDALVNHTGHTHAAASAARGYNSGTHPAGTSVWFLPSAGQWEKMLTAAGSYSNLRTNAGLQSADYWSSTEYSSSHACYCDFNNGTRSHVGKDFNFRVRACLAF